MKFTEGTSIDYKWILLIWFLDKIALNGSFEPCAGIFFVLKDRLAMINKNFLSLNFLSCQV